MRTHINKKTFAFLVCISSSLFYFFQVLQANMFNSLSNSLMKTFSLDAGDIGILSTSYFYANVLFLFLAGIVIDHISRRRLLLWACAANVCSITGFALAQEAWQIFICHFLDGLAGTLSLISCLRLIKDWFPKEKMATLSGLTMTLGGVGGLLSQTPFIYLIEKIGWRMSVLFVSGLGFCIFLLILFFVKDNPNAAVEKSKPFSIKKIKDSLFEVIKKSQNWLFGVVAIGINIPNFLLSALWGNLFLVQAYQFTPVQASIVNSMLFFGGITGSFLLGWISDYFGRRKLVIQLVTGLAILVSIGFFKPQMNFFLWFLVVFFMAGFLSGALGVLYVFAKETNDSKITSSVHGFIMNILMMGGFSQSVFSWLMEMKWDQTIKEGVPFYSISDYHRALLIIPILFAVAFFLSNFLKTKNSEKK